MADDFHLRHIFSAIRSLAVENREVRQKKRMFDDLVPDFNNFNLKRRGLK